MTKAKPDKRNYKYIMRFWKGHRDTYIGWFSVGVPGGLLMSGIINRLFNNK